VYTNIKFNKAAFRHKITEDDIRRVLSRPRFDGAIDEDDENKYLAIGFDNAGNLLEIMYNLIDEQSVNVFHAMKCRRIFLQYLDYQE
jgi:hypothetical protein